MPNYQIITDSACDLPAELLQNLNVEKVSLSVLFRGENRPDSVDAGIKEFYDGLRASEVATTSAVNPENWKSVIEPSFRAGHDALVLAFSSGLSTTYQSAVIAAQELMEQYPDRKAYVVDTLCASLGEGLLVWYACRKRDEGLSLESLRDWVEQNKLNFCHFCKLYRLQRSCGEVYLRSGVGQLTIAQPCFAVVVADVFLAIGVCGPHNRCI